ncbi:filamentous haemagglutinin family protein [Dechloromonas sp. HYN0024]|uniref:filamentous haemagglutinin family protein n=1 Tax=Dechloromonas sp. HYN0024 TaxID=2231055 RepID=UPI000E432000|nr:filamentous haemagglutinin family protein [Dechloromonas sp. HYN0024]AXS80133.1 filamentous hemagglutinin N-terminal domain-containing protein [Dechloromonas sp. HYN0024]
MTLRKSTFRRNFLSDYRKSVIADAIQRCFDGCAVVAAAGLLVCNPAIAQSARNWTGKIPLPSGPVSQNLVSGSSTIRQPQIVAGSFNPYQVNGTTATITQTDAAGILRWDSFDIAPGYKVTIIQPGTSSVLLNKVSGGAFDNQTAIDGMLQGVGQIYIYNPNGIVFGKNSRVDVNSLVATTLKIDDRRFLEGLLAPNISPVFIADPDATKTDANGVVSLVGRPGAITVEGDGTGQASMTAGTGGKILLVAPSIVNNGQLSAPDGQVALAAGQSVYLASPSDIRMRGLLIEVNNDAVNSANGNQAIPAAGSSVVNDVFGKISVGTGNATLVGLAVNQMGMVSATTSVNVNGSIYLHARDGATQGSITAPTPPNHGGTLVLGSNSTTQILPTLEDPTTTSGSSFNPSLVDLSGKSVHLLSNAKIVAPAGEVNVSASVSAETRGVTSTPGSGASIALDSGALIDVSGTTSTKLAMESNVIKVDLRGTEFADDPLLRNSILRGQTVSVDARKGNLKIANIQGWLDLVEHGVGERSATGGTVKLQADDAIVLNADSKINVSGGIVSYLGGNVVTSQLSSLGRYFDINSATPDRIYDGVVTPAPDPVTGLPDPRTFEAGYTQGYSAGTITVVAPTLSLVGTLSGTASPGPKQRDISSAGRPLGGALVIGNQVDLSQSPDFVYQNKVTIGSANSGLVIDPTTLTDAGFSRLSVYGGGDITVNAPVKLPAGGSLTLISAGTTEISAPISAPGGKISVGSQSQVTVDPGVRLDVAGKWTNDRVLSAAEVDAQGNPISPLVNSGGSISLSGPSMVVGSGASFDASGGAWMNSTGKISAGTGGSISISASTDPAFSLLSLGSDLSFSAYGLNAGGTLTLSGRGFTLGGTPTDVNDLGLSSSFFQKGGFATYDIRAARNITVASGATIAPRVDNWMSNRLTANVASGKMSDAFSIATLPLGSVLGSRGASSLRLSALPQLLDGMGKIDVEAGASIVTDPGATVSLAAGRQITVDGTIEAHGGTINLTLTPAINSGLPYRPERSIWIGSQAVLDASGTASRLWRDGTALTQGSLLGGGTIQIGRFDSGNLVAAPGYVVVEAGARLDVSGTTATMQLPVGSASRGGQQSNLVASAGGSIDIRASQGLVLEGTLAAAGGNTTAAGGSLSIVLDREWKPGNLDPAGYPAAARNLQVTADNRNIPTLPAADTPLSGWEGQGFVLASSLNRGGFDWIKLKSQNVVSFDLGRGSLALRARAGLTVDAPAIAAAPGALANSSLTLTAPYVQLGSADWRYQTAPASSASTVGGVSLVADAGTVDLIGYSALQGFDAASIYATGDVRLVGQVAADLNATPPTSQPLIESTGRFSVTGKMDLTSAQVYPTSLSQFELATTGSGNEISFASNGNAATQPLTAGGSLTVTAQNITQNGVVRAPLGSIVFDAVDTLSYGAASQTSVNATGTIPLGFVQNGRDWLYDFGNGNAVDLNNVNATNYYALPDKRIVSRGRSVNFGSGAILDLSGGGDLYAYEFTPGPGGSRDVLAKATGSASANVFAILPGYSIPVAPRDYQYAQDGGLKPGDSVYLSGVSGLAAGYYTLLPGHYALMPGAFTVSAVAGTTDMVSRGNNQKVDGSWMVAGYRATLGGGRDNRWSGFLLTSAAQVRTQSEFADYSANKFLSSLATSPVSGGHVVFDVSQSLNLDGVVRLAAAAGGSSGIADISAPEIAIVSDRASALPGESGAGALKLAVGDLTALGADSLLLGGVRTASGAVDQLVVGADKIIVANSEATALTGPEIILAANGTIKMKSGSSLVAQGTLSHTPRALAISDKSSPTTGADGALLRVSTGAQITAQRSQIAADGSISAPAGAKGTLEVEAGAKLAATGSVMLDATKSTLVGGPLALGNGTALGLGANRISFGSGAPGDVSGLRFDDAALSALNNLSSLSFTSYSTIDVYGTVNLGNSATQNLSFMGAGMRAMAGGHPTQATFTAQTIRFDNAGVDATTGANGGSVTFNARDIEIGNGAFALHGFTTATLSASNDVRAAGKGGALSTDANLVVAAGRITARGGADAALTAAGALHLNQGHSVVGTLAAPESGGSLSFVGNDIVSDATIVANSGKVKLTASDRIDINRGTISAAGTSQVFGSTVAYAPAGSIALDAGSILLGSTATLDVSSVGADAGSISVKAVNGSGTGQATLNGTMKGTARSGIDGFVPAQGRFAMDVDQLDPAMSFGALNAKLDSNGFTESRAFRVRHADVALANSETMTARQSVIAVDNGNINIAGKIDARGPKGGSIELYAAEDQAGTGSGNIVIASTARLVASASTVVTSAAGSTGDGGSIVIGTATANGSQPTAISGDASITVNSGAVLDVSGNGAGQGGTLLLRAPRLNTNNDVAIVAFDTSTVQGSRSIGIEAYKVYTASRISAAADSSTNLNVANTSGAATGKMYTEANTFIANASTILGRFAGSQSVALMPGMEVRSTGDLTVSVNETLATGSKQNRGWNLDTWRFNGQPGMLTLRAGGNLLINGSISDGFDKATAATAAMPDWSLDTSARGASSWSYRLVGGADSAAANPQATLLNTGDVRLSFARTSGTGTDLPVAMVRTGTGFINIAAGRDVLLDTLDLTTGTLLGGSFVSMANFSGNPTVGASLYTAGKTSALSTAIKSNNNAAYGSTTSTGAGFTSGGGAISILAGRNVVGPVTNQMINNWLFRQGRSYEDATGAILFDSKSGKLQNTAWWSRPDYFNQGIATFGGGDITVIAETGDVTNVSASVATNANFSGTSPSNGQLIEQGGGDLLVRAGGDIRGGVFYAQKGSATLSAAGSIVAGDHIVEDMSVSGTGPNGGALVSLRPVLAGGDTQFRVSAGKNLEIESAFNPTMAVQSATNVTGNIGDPFTLTPGTLPEKFSTYLTYGSTSAVTLTSVSGNVLLSENANAIKAAGGTELLDLGDSFLGFYLMYPGTLRTVALNGNITFQHGFSLAPAASGQLDLLAKGSIVAQFNRDANGVPTGTTQPIVMIDRDPATMPTALSPKGVDQSIVDALQAGADGLSFHTAGGLHASDTNPAHIIAINGDIDFRGDGYFPATVVLPKRAEISAGRDILDFGFAIQQLSTSDVTTVTAGRDIVTTTKVGGKNVVGDVVTGPGRIDFTAGRNFDLGNGTGVVTRGNLDNPYLPAQGAGIDIVAGARPDYAVFISLFFNANNFSAADLPATGQQAFIAYMTRLYPSLGTNLTTLTQRFNGLPDAQRNGFFLANKELLNDAFFNYVRTIPSSELMAGFLSPTLTSAWLRAPEVSTLGLSQSTGTTTDTWPTGDQVKLIAYMRSLDPSLPSEITPDRAVELFKALPIPKRIAFVTSYTDYLSFLGSSSDKGKNFNLEVFDAIIAGLFPTASITGGDVNVFGSQLKTDRGGSINVFAPGGSVYAGLTNIPGYLKTKKASDLGIFTIGGGDLQSLVKTDFLVNQGRVFTLGGGGITLVSQYGNIDAGKGAKTAQSAPPPLLTTDEKGNTQVDISSSISGSGIATLRAGPDVPESSVYPIAPRGIFDAGDAGVRSTGGVNIVAQTVLNANNIAAAGSVSGAKTTDTSGLGGAVATPASTPVAKTDSFNNTGAADPNAATSLTVELLGYGEASSAGVVAPAAPVTAPASRNTQQAGREERTAERNFQQPVTQGNQTVTPVESDDQRKKKKLL